MGGVTCYGRGARSVSPVVSADAGRIFTKSLTPMRRHRAGAPRIFSTPGQVAQLVEQRTENPCVGGSSPPLATSLRLRSLQCGLSLLLGSKSCFRLGHTAGTKPLRLEPFVSALCPRTRFEHNPRSTMATLVKNHGRYYLQFYSADRSPARKRVALQTSDKRSATQHQKRLEAAYFENRFDPWRDDPRTFEDKEAEHVSVSDAFARFLAAGRVEGKSANTIRSYEGIRRLFERVVERGQADPLCGVGRRGAVCSGREREPEHARHAIPSPSGRVQLGQAGRVSHARSVRVRHDPEERGHVAEGRSSG